MGDWKQHHANEAQKVLESELVRGVMEEFASNMRFKLEGLPEYGLRKVVCYAAQVARAQALGFDPELLRLTDEEADEVMLRVAEAAALAGKPVWLIDASVSTNEGGEEARLEFEIHGGYHYLKVRCAPELVERLRDWVECGRFRFEPTHDGSAVLVVDTEHAGRRLAALKKNPSPLPSLWVTVSEELVEKVGRAICEADPFKTADWGDLLPERDREEYLGMARASVGVVLDAVRERVNGQRVRVLNKTGIEETQARAHNEGIRAALSSIESLGAEGGSPE